MEGVRAYLGLGTNLGRREENLVAAIQGLSKGSDISERHPLSQRSDAIKVLRSSSVYQTAPWGFTEQPDFLNCVLEVETRLLPTSLLECAKAVEEALGRQPAERYGPRLIDIDILLFGEEIVAQADLQIPHPRLHLRAFALIPLAELGPDLVHPVLNLTVAQLAEEVDGQEGVKIWGPPPIVADKGRVRP